MKYFFPSLCFALILLFLSSQAFASPIIPENYFIVNILDKETGKFVGKPAYLNVVEREGNTVLRKYNLTVRDSPAQFNVAWFVPNYKGGTVIEITAIKDGYTSDKLEYIVKDVISQKLFEHTFYLQRMRAEKLIEIQYYQQKFVYDDREFFVNLATTSAINTVEFNPSIQKILLELNEQSNRGFANITIPKQLLGGPFVVMRNNVVLHSTIINENATHSTFSLGYGTGQQSIRIIGSSAIPEFSVNSNIIVLAGLSIVVIFGIFISRKRFGRLLNSYFVLKE